MGKGVFFIVLILFMGCTPKQKAYDNRAIGEAFGTSYSIIYLADRELDFQTAFDSVFNAVNQSMSTYWPNSDISKINQGDSTVVVDAMFQEVFTVSADIFKKTKGYFDPTVGTLVNAWGFGPGTRMELDSTRVDSLMQFVGFEKVRLKHDNTIDKRYPTVYFDFNAVAKGYAVDRLALVLDQKGLTDYLIEVGGELRARGTNLRKRKKWLVGIDDPQAPDELDRKKLITLGDRALASSGNYRKYRVDPTTGRKYVHTIDPKTGYTKNSSTLSVTVLANTCAEADAYATAFMAMPLNMAQEILMDEMDLEGYVVYLDDKGHTQEFMTPGFKATVLNAQ
ncbi:MAG: FAD:protein FMN transferase [Flavobacteriaceae bacterium]